MTVIANHFFSITSCARRSILRGEIPTQWKFGVVKTGREYNPVRVILNELCTNKIKIFDAIIILTTNI